MLQMNCPNCKGVISSPFLAEVASIECGHCKENVQVVDVFVKTKSFTIHRDDLIKRIVRYRNLLREVEKEQSMLENDSTVSDATKRSVSQFYVTLQELLAGARNNFRLAVPFDMPIEIASGAIGCVAKLTNLSSEGASISLLCADKLPRANAELLLKFSLPNNSEPMSVRGRVIWIRKQNKKDSCEIATIGVSFVGLEDEIRHRLWDFILDTESPEVSLTPTLASKMA